MEHTFAQPCAGHEPLVFERGVCFHCGRFLASEIGRLEEASESIGYGALAAAVNRAGEELRREALDAGYLDTPERYRHFIETRMQTMEREEHRRLERERRRPRAVLASPA